MRAMILAAGLGNRMRPLTLTTPKPLLTVAGKPLIVWHIEALKKIGVTEIVINAAWLKEKLVTALGDGKQFGVNITWSLEDEGLETAGGIIQALPLLGEAPFLLINGDVWTRYDFSELLDFDFGVYPVQHPKGDFVLAKERLFTFEQQQDGEALTFSGISVLSPRLFANLSSGKRPLAPLLKAAMHRQQVSGKKIQQAWVDVGTPERLTQLNQQVENQVI